MGQKLAAEELELYKRIDEVLHYLWDPIGVSSAPGARDEYHSYLPVVFGLTQKGDAKKQIAEYLNQIQSVHMGLSEDLKKCTLIAEIIMDWKDYLGKMPKEGAKV